MTYQKLNFRGTYKALLPHVDPSPFVCDSLNCMLHLQPSPCHSVPDRMSCKLQRKRNELRRVKWSPIRSQIRLQAGETSVCFPCYCALRGGPPPVVHLVALWERQGPTRGAVPEVVSTDLKFQPKDILFEFDTYWPPNLLSIYSPRARFYYLVQSPLCREPFLSRCG